MKRAIYVEPSISRGSRATERSRSTSAQEMAAFLQWIVAEKREYLHYGRDDTGAMDTEVNARTLIPISTLKLSFSFLEVEACVMCCLKFNFRT
jgi:hypothetical protein